jgi:acetyl-CoA synthetase
MFLGYWNDEKATAGKFIGDWLITGDTGRMDADQYITFIGRNDDVITSAGYRIGPGPIEDCLLSHPAVRMAAVVGVPDAQRTEIVKAFVVLQDGFGPSETLTKDLQDHVRTRLAAHEYPRQVRYVEALPLTNTGKIIRRELRNLQD